MLRAESLFIILPAVCAAASPTAPSWIAWVDYIIRGMAVVGAPTILIVSLVQVLRGKRLTLRERGNSFHMESVLVVVAAFLVSAVAAYGLLDLVGPGWPSELGQLVSAAIAQAAALVACLTVVHRQFDGGIAVFVIGDGRTRRFRTAALILLVAMLAIGLCEGIAVATVKAVHYFTPDHEFEPHRTLQALRDPLQPVWVIPILWLSAVVLAPVVEESFFRGLIQTLVASNTRRPWLAIGFSSIFFALVHWSQIETVPAIFVLGLILGYVYERAGALWPVVVIHALFNLRTMLWVSLGAYPE
jgi:membrane protease YdiL (CAAX protease family)